jgi:hypothetical protein
MDPGSAAPFGMTNIDALGHHHHRRQSAAKSPTRSSSHTALCHAEALAKAEAYPGSSLQPQSSDYIET